VCSSDLVIPTWNAGTPVADAPERANELFLPHDLRPGL